MMKIILKNLTLWSLCLLLAPAWGAERTTYYHLDLLGSPAAASDSSGQVVWREEYKPYGERTLRQDQNTNALWYTGKVHEDALGLSYYGARWYDPELGRFTGIDPVEFQEGDQTTFNRYSYVGNNPYKFIDPDGRQRVAPIFTGAGALWYAGSYGGARGSLGGIGGVVPRSGLGATGTNARAVVPKSASKAPNNSPDFIVSPGGTAFPVPKGATGPSPVVNPGGKTTGSAFTGGKGGANNQVDTMRIMNPTPPRGKSPGYPNGYIKYENKAGQGVDPYTGRTLSNKNSHFPID